MADNPLVLHLTDDTFETEVLKSPLPVLVDFWAEWCGPCKAIAPVVGDLATAYSGRLKVCKVNVDDHQRYAGRFNITAIPTLLIFKNGQVVDQIVGALPKAKLVERLERHLAA
ncbi:MAG TPA: thioredoxin [Myxococcota bacterium]|nr:thioredoxin [Myxococcota bacterium]HQK51083.1 thioredoxin [Myxococcota bacterium]